MEPFEIAPPGNFVVVVFPVRPTIEVARFHRKGGARSRWTRWRALCTSTNKSVNRSALRTAFIRSRSSCHPKAMTTNTGLKMPMNRTSGSSRKASWIALGDRGLLLTGRAVHCQAWSAATAWLSSLQIQECSHAARLSKQQRRDKRSNKQTIKQTRDAQRDLIIGNDRVVILIVA